MPMHQDLLSLARHLVDRNPGAPVEADLRRGVSTAYYALFHLLIYEAMDRFLVDPAFRHRVGRAFQHGSMKDFCKWYAKQTVNPAGVAVPAQLRQIASEFVALQEARHQADYDTGITMTHVQADTEVQRAEGAFVAWTGVQADPETTSFLQELFCRSIMRR